MLKEELIDLLEQDMECDSRIVGKKKYALGHALQVKCKDGSYFNIIIYPLEDTTYNLIDGKSFVEEILNRR